MANPNLNKIDLVEVQPFQNGERANADNLNRPIIQLRDNIVSQKGVLDSVIDMLSSNNTSLDDLQEVADFIEQNKEELRDLTGLMNEGGKLRLDSRLGQSNIDAITYNAEGDLDVITYASINFYDSVANTASSKVFAVSHEYSADQLLEKVVYSDSVITESTETKTIAVDKITVDNTIESITSITIDGTLYEGTTTISGNEITLEDNSNDTLNVEVVYNYKLNTEYANNTFTYSGDNVTGVTWTLA